MSKQYPGGIISKTPPTPSGPYEDSTASGIWTLDQQAYWAKLGQWPTAGNFPKDAQFNYVTMLLHGDGTNGAQNNTFVDSSTNNFTITRNGNTTQGSFSPYGSNWSNYFNGTTDYLDSSSSAAQFGTGSFTVELWVYPTVASATALVDFRATSTAIFGQIYFAADLTVHFYLPTDIATSNTLTLNAWNHVAISRQSNTLKMFINGVSGYSATNSNNYNAGGLRIGAGINGGNILTGNLSNLRIVVGTGVYTSNFTPPIAPLTAISGTSLLTCQSNRFIDNSTNAYAITRTGTPSVQRFNPFGTSTAYSTSVIGGSGYFDGSGDYLSVADNASLELGSSDFCIEGWYFPQSFAANLALVSKRANTTAVGAAIIYANSGSGALTFYASTNGSSYFWSGTTVGTMVLNQWNHFAVYRSGNNWYGAMNGVVSSMGSNSSSIYNNTDAWTLGGDTNGNYANGYIASSRIVIGSAVYGASNFTPPTSPLTAITNTALLANYTNGAIYDNAMMNDLETVGNAQISTSVVKYGTGSLYFDGTGDCLTTPSSVNANFGTGDFTIEMWVYANSIPTYSNAAFLVDSRTNASWFIFLASNKLYFGDSSSTEYNGGTINTGAWYHVAICRSSGTTKGFVGGVQAFTFSDSGSYAGSPVLTIGARYSNTLNLDGYIDDLRITKGYARYTSNFTPPTAAFPDIGPN